MDYQNPVLPGFYPDPSVCRVGKDYYLVTSSAEYFPGIPVFHSLDLIHWEQIGHCLTRASQIPLTNVPPSGGIWAPTIRYHEGIFYVASTNVTGHGNFYVTATDPAGEWSEPIWVDMGGIDPSLTFDKGHVYLTTNLGASDGRSGISQAEINPETGKLISEIRFLWTGTGGRAAEAPHLYAIGGWYYLMIAEGGTQFTHMETIARSKSPWGPFESCTHNPILTNIPVQTPGVHCIGHGDLVEDANGNWWMVHLGIRLARRYMSHIGRETFLSAVSWNDDGWPVVNGNKCVSLDSCGHDLVQFPVPHEISLDHFDGESLAYCWNYLRNPHRECYCLAQRKSCLTLYGNSFDISDLESPALLVRRQRYFCCRIRAKMDFCPQKENQEAGILILATNLFYYKLSKRLMNGQSFICVEKRADDFCQIAACVPAPAGEVTLHIEATRSHYHFYYSGDHEPIYLASASTRFLACEVIGRSFTGVYVGMFATGKGQPCMPPAYFDYFSLEETKEAPDAKLE